MRRTKPLLLLLAGLCLILACSLFWGFVPRPPAEEEPPGSNLAFSSDDFCANSLNTSLWTAVFPANPDFDVTIDTEKDNMNEEGSLVIDISLSEEGEAPIEGYDKFEDEDAPRIMQSVADQDFLIEVKFQSDPNCCVNDQGIVLEENSTNWIRFSIYYSSGLKGYATRTRGGNNEVFPSLPNITSGANFLRMQRIKNMDGTSRYIMSYSPDGSSWTVFKDVMNDLNPSSVGVYAANPGNQDFTCKVDYFFNNASPISPEDDCFGALPLDLLRFEAQVSDARYAHLHWQTANEQSTSHFEVERSTDGKAWGYLGRVEAAGDSQEEREYQYLDKEAHGPGLYYYRLRMADLDGTYEYSPLRAVAFDTGKEVEIAVFPNPFNRREGLSVEVRGVLLETPLQLRLLNLAGQEVFLYRPGTGGRFTLPVPGPLPAGIYWLELSAAEQQLGYRQLILTD